VENLLINVLITLLIITYYPMSGGGEGDIHRFIPKKNKRFPPFFAEKRYKLINFAPKTEIVDKLP